MTVHQLEVRKLISSSSFHRLDMTLAVAEAVNPNKPKPNQLEVWVSYFPWIGGSVRDGGFTPLLPKFDPGTGHRPYV